MPSPGREGVYPSGEDLRIKLRGGGRPCQASVKLCLKPIFIEIDPNEDQFLAPIPVNWIPVLGDVIEGFIVLWPAILRHI